MSSDLKKNNRFRIFLIILLFLGIYSLLVVLLVYVEQDSQQSNLTNYANAIWYSLATLTTVGYGDLFPGTVYGRFIGYILMITSIFIFGILIGQLTNLMAKIKEDKKLGYSGTSLKGHAVIIGWNEFGWHVVDQLVGVGRSVAIVTNKKDDVELIQEKYHSKKVFVLFSEYSNIDLLRKTNIEESSIVFINMEDDTEKLVYVLNIKKSFPNVEFVVMMENADLRDTFVAAGVTNTISTKEISSKLLASYMFEPDVASYSESILSYATSDSDYDIKQLVITDKNPYNGKSYQEVFFDLKKKYNSVLIGITKRDKFGNKRLIKNPLGELTLATGDYLIIILSGKAYKLLKRVFGVEEGMIKK